MAASLHAYPCGYPCPYGEPHVWLTGIVGGPPGPIPMVSFLCPGVSADPDASRAAGELEPPADHS